MPHSGFAIDSSHSDPWFLAIGKFMMNMGGIEFMTHQWITQLSTDSVLIDVAIDSQLSRRIDVVRKIVERSPVSKALKKRSATTWEAVKKLCTLRNTIAHSPIIFGWRGREEERPPDFIGAFNPRKRNEKLVPLVQLKAVNAAIDEAAKLAQVLEQLLKQAIAELEARKANSTSEANAR